jgi:beta-glucosidase/6-phospho-beta-glucosidase/beta-galactosidase
VIRKVAFLKAFLAGALGAAVWELVFRLLVMFIPIKSDISNLLGTLILPPSSIWSYPAGLTFHLMVGGVWAVFYAYFFWSAFKIKPVFQGLLFSLIPSMAAGLTIVPQLALMHPLIINHTLPEPGFFAANFGWQGPLGIFVFHSIFGIVLGLCYTRPVGYATKKESRLLRWKRPGRSEILHALPWADRDAFMFCTGIECSYPTIEKGRWRMDELELTRHYEFWENDLGLVAKMKIPYLRYGPPIHWIFRAPGKYDWSFLDAVLERTKKLGITPIIDLCHFGLPKWLGNFQNQEFPYYLKEYAQAMSERYPWIRYWNPVNEIYVTARESTLQGNWNEGLKSEKAFVNATCNMVRASHLVMQSILEIRKDALFITSESSEFYQACCPQERIQKIADFENQRRFIATDLLYSNPIREDIKNYLFDNGMSNEQYNKYMQAQFNRRMIMGLDYYDWNEKLININGNIERLGELFGWYVITKQYYDRYKRPLFHSETNSPDARQGPGWLWRQWHNINLMLQDGIPVIGFTWYSLQDQVDWDIGLSVPQGNINPVGLFDLNRDARDTVLAYKQILKMYADKKLDRKLIEEIGL